MAGYRLHVSVPPAAEHSGFLFRQKGQDPLRLLRLALRPHQGNGGLVQPPSRGLAVGTEPGAHQHLEHGVPHVGQADGTDSAQLVVGEIRFKIVFHKGLLGEQKFSYRNILPHFPRFVTWDAMLSFPQTQLELRPSPLLFRPYGRMIVY